MNRGAVSTVVFVFVCIASSESAQLKPNAGRQQTPGQTNQGNPSASSPQPATPNPTAFNASDQYAKDNLETQRALARLTKYLVIIGGIIGFLQIGLMFWTALVAHRG